MLGLAREPGRFVSYDPDVPARPFMWRRTVRKPDGPTLPTAIVVRRPSPRAWAWGYVVGTVLAIAVHVLTA